MLRAPPAALERRCQAAPPRPSPQGHEWLFGDPVRVREEGNYAAQDQLFHMAMHLPVAVAAVSGARRAGAARMR